MDLYEIKIKLNIQLICYQKYDILFKIYVKVCNILQNITNFTYNYL